MSSILSLLQVLLGFLSVGNVLSWVILVLALAALLLVLKAWR